MTREQEIAERWKRPKGWATKDEIIVAAFDDIAYLLAELKRRDEDAELAFEIEPELQRLRRIEKAARGFMDTFDRIPEPPTNDVHLAANELRDALKGE